jgi:hypothetical protein
MTAGEMAYLIGVVVAFTVFSVALAYEMWRNP